MDPRIDARKALRLAALVSMLSGAWLGRALALEPVEPEYDPDAWARECYRVLHRSPSYTLEKLRALEKRLVVSQPPSRDLRATWLYHTDREAYDERYGGRYARVDRHALDQGLFILSYHAMFWTTASEELAEYAVEMDEKLRGRCHLPDVERFYRTAGATAWELFAYQAARELQCQAQADRLLERAASLEERRLGLGESLTPEGDAALAGVRDAALERARSL
ncbi:MAG: hypothetical protein HY554_09125 [Elusimicrobia bacterium]|nr:hypothetical protein [Elusimicrobiota bacterium]